MQERYQPETFEAKWRARWKDSDLFKTREEAGRPKFYGLDFFPYPSGAGLSVGHCRNYIPTDVLCRMKVMQGFNVLHPMGFDAFGLPAENEAIKKKRHPAPMIDDYAGTYQRQMELIGISYDWSRSFKSSDPGYYKWTQWIFKRLYEKGLAYRRMAAVNWDPVDRTVLADEEVIGGRAERSGALVEKKLIPQWFMKITAYADRLIDDLDELDWPEGIKNQQRNWIGRSKGAEFEMELDLPGAEPDGEFEVIKDGKSPNFRVFTTRMDTIFGMSFCVLAPEHPLVEQILAKVDAERAQAIKAYQLAAKELSDIDRQATGREKSGVFTGAYAVNPANGERVPLFLADYVLMGYGTGAIMAVPGHDQRDFDFALAFDLPIVPVIEPSDEYLSEFCSAGGDSRKERLAWYEANIRTFSTVSDAKEGKLMNSGAYTGLEVSEAQEQLGIWLESEGRGERKTMFRLRDWLISRQRYWGCPIPVSYDSDGIEESVPDDALPVLLPEVDNYEPSGDGTSPLASIPEFVNCTTRDGRLGTRETDTMGGFACSSWYFLRFCDPHNDDLPWDFEKAKLWMPVDCYVGGAEHAVMHLLYARFWTKFLYDEGLVTVKEPFARLMNQGQVLAQTPYRQPREGERLGVGESGILVSFADAKELPQDDLTWKWVRMSKSKGNVVTPDEAVADYGADALRIYELFVAPFEANILWSNEGMQGACRFLDRIFRLAGQMEVFYEPNWKHEMGEEEPTPASKAVRQILHQTLIKVTEDIEGFAFNTAVSSLMIMTNTLSDLLKKADKGSRADRLAISEALEVMVLMISPLAPHTADELWESLGRSGFTYQQDWPKGDPVLAKPDEIEIAVQVNGKLRDTLSAAADAPQSVLEEAAKASAKVQVHLEGKTIRKVIVVPGRLVNIVAN